jgi:hypothetical protein
LNKGALSNIFNWCADGEDGFYGHELEYVLALLNRANELDLIKSRGGIKNKPLYEAAERVWDFVELPNVKNQLVPIIKRKLLEEADASAHEVESSGEEDFESLGEKVESFTEGAEEVKSSAEEVESATLHEAGSATTPTTPRNEMGKKIE